MINYHQITQPSAGFCFGRDALCERLLRDALERGAVLLLGGRQSGKTTILLRISHDLRKARGDICQMHHLDVGVYIDLRDLAFDAVPADFFRMLARRARDECQRAVDGYPSIDLPS